MMNFDILSILPSTFGKLIHRYIYYMMVMITSQSKMAGWSLYCITQLCWQYIKRTSASI